MNDAIETALALPQEEQVSRMKKMVDAVDEFTVTDWADEQLQSLETVD